MGILGIGVIALFALGFWFLSDQRRSKKALPNPQSETLKILDAIDAVDDQTLKAIGEQKRCEIRLGDLGVLRFHNGLFEELELSASNPIHEQAVGQHLSQRLGLQDEPIVLEQVEPSKPGRLLYRVWTPSLFGSSQSGEHASTSGD